MIVRQLFDYDTWTYTYLIAGARGSEAVLIDPVLDKVDRYLQLLEELNLKLVKVIDTHVHADHITGMGALRDRTQCITIMGEQSKVNVVSQRVVDGDIIEVSGVRMEAIYTPGHTDDSYCFTLENRVFTGDTLFIRGTGRTDFQNGDPGTQYDSIWNRLLTLPEETLVYPGHDYKGDTISTIGEEKRFNPRLQVGSREEYIDLMNNLNLENPRYMDVAVPANLKIGLSQEDIDGRHWAIDAETIRQRLAEDSILLIDLREKSERARKGSIEPSLHSPYNELDMTLVPGGLLFELIKSSDKEIVFYCAYGERSAMALQRSRELGLSHTYHLKGGIDSYLSL
ncbi:MAG: MBL fold metallo-hydrolase [Gammaproteobacteria bacterium]|nr:MBL fold metallo-hydrolase [Gammaproteobacteria bacterium]